ncbi:hypothetical protein SCP_0901750 [Sparassis crispa]|uniref:Uncharacterized protein n=1 Tax=Sparassis crispa TaxID=139825 RepID=A0A401GVQ8_9APHY|nr:hypothetical protein SCP_0901750 [Sparassis crispa]GBE86296.1 hypothetical protein SCP_0901750 [Sparassis crispa]
MSSWGDTAFGTYTRPVYLLFGMEVSPLVSRLMSSIEAMVVDDRAVAAVEAPSIPVFAGVGDRSTPGDWDVRDLTPIDVGGETALAAPAVDEDFVWPTSARPELVSLPDVSSDIQYLGSRSNELLPIDICLVGFSESTEDVNTMPEGSGGGDHVYTPISQSYTSEFLSDW